MTDRELLELAARAAGIEVTPHPNAKHDKSLVFLSKGQNWNPLLDPGDALRLAVALRMAVDVCNDGAEIWTGSPCFVEALEKFGDNPLAATCRAITRAAAEIGKGMEP